jgi:hypothetical protein
MDIILPLYILRLKELCDTLRLYLYKTCFSCLYLEIHYLAEVILEVGHNCTMVSFVSNMFKINWLHKNKYKIKKADYLLAVTYKFSVFPLNIKRFPYSNCNVFCTSRLCTLISYFLKHLFLHLTTSYLLTLSNGDGDDKEKNSYQEVRQSRI